MLQPDSHRFLNQPTRPGERVHEKCVGNLKTGCVPMSETVKTRPDKENEAVCAACGRQPNVQAGFKPLLRCGSCKAAWYCGKSCQHSDWKNHKDKCVKMRKERKERKKWRAVMIKRSWLRVVVQDDNIHWNLSEFLKNVLI